MTNSTTKRMIWEHSFVTLYTTPDNILVCRTSTFSFFFSYWVRVKLILVAIAWISPGPKPKASHVFFVLFFFFFSCLLFVLLLFACLLHPLKFPTRFHFPFLNKMLFAFNFFQMRSP